MISSFFFPLLDSTRTRHSNFVPNFASLSWLHANTRFDANDPTSSFVEGLGAGQIVSRQALASPYLGDIQLSLSDRKGNLEVEVIRARRLQSKPGSKTLPCKYLAQSPSVGFLSKKKKKKKKEER